MLWRSSLFFFASRRRHTRCGRDWSSDVCSSDLEPLPLGVLVAATAGWMGYMIQQSLQNALARAGVTRQVVTLITQTLCDPHDPNLRSPTKPIGHALDRRGWRDSRRGAFL